MTMSAAGSIFFSERPQSPASTRDAGNYSVGCICWDYLSRFMVSLISLINSSEAGAASFAPLY